MKKFLTIMAIMMMILCGSMVLVSCSNNYKKMYLVVEYALPTENKEVNWIEVESGKNFDYTISDSNSKIYMRVKVKGTSKKVNSLYVSQSANNSTFLQNNTIKPNETFEVLVKNIGSVRFTVTPSQGGEDKAISFGVNIYKKLTGVSQNPECVPAVVTGGYVELGKLTNLIKYAPIGETNQTGVDFEIAGVGTLNNNGETNLIDREFQTNGNFTEQPVDEGGNVIDRFVNTQNDNGSQVSLERANDGVLRLNVSNSDPYKKYNLSNENNVIKLIATSQYDKTLQTPVYVYIVENFENALLVSYNSNSNEVIDDAGNIKDDATVTKPINNNIVIYNSAISGNVVEQEYNSVDIYTYTNTSIYSYESNPGLKLNVFVNGTLYDYNDVVNNNFGIQISPIVNQVAGQDKLVGLKFAVNPNSMSTEKEYKIRLEVDFTAFNFSASDKAPVSVLNKEFTINVESLASGFRINRKGYGDNLQQIKDENVVPSVSDYHSSKSAILYTHYEGNVKGMSLDIQATPEDASARVYVGFYRNYTINTEGQLTVNANDNLISSGSEGSNAIQLLNPFGYSVGTAVVDEFGTQFVIESTKGKGIEYFLRINPFASASLINSLGKNIYMVCRAVCTPNSFGGQEVETSYITFVSKIDVVGAVDNIYLYKSEGNNVSEDTLTDKYLQNGVTNTMYVKFTSTSSVVDLSDIVINSKDGKIKFSHNGVTWADEIKAGELDCANNICTLYFKTERECVDSVVVTSPNGVTKSREYEFVNVARNITIDYDDSYMWDSRTTDDVAYIEYIKNDKGVVIETKEHSADLQYLALQSGKTAQFNVKGDGKGANINSVRAKSLLVSSDEYLNIKKGGASLYSKAISTFSASAIRVTNLGGNLFDIQANSVGFTAILFVKVDYYTHVTIEGKTSIQLQSKYFVYEVAIYNPARDISVTTDKDSIIYINDNYADVATLEFNISLNSGVTRNVYFSSSDVNERINVGYGDDSNKSIYGIKVRYGYDSELLKENNSGDELLHLTGLNNKDNSMYVDITSRKFTIRALDVLKDIEVIKFEFTVCQFGKEFDVSRTTKIVSVGSYSASDRVVIVSGVEAYNNVYLSIGDSKGIKAYASNDKNDVTYKDLGFELYQIANDQAGDRLIPYNGEDLTVDPNIEDDTFIINAKNNGGVYLLRLIAKDSGKYTDIKITVSDGKSEETAYLIKTTNDFKNYLKGNTTYTVGTETKPLYYTLWQDIDFDGLDEDWWSDWWGGNRQFGGVLNGSIVIEDLNSDKKITRNYALKNFTIDTSSMKDYTNGDVADYCFGLFSMITITGQINNVAFDSVKANISLYNNGNDDKNTAVNAVINIGIIAGINNGLINSCSIDLANGAQEVVLKNSAQSLQYNIGLLTGVNNGDITYETINAGSAYSRMIDCTGATLVVTAQKGNSNFSDKTIINLGGIAGLNAKNISSNYSDNSSASIRELISVVTNIEFVSEYDNTNQPMNIATNFGGVVGLNNGSVTNVAMSGALKANDNINLGGIVGNNTANIEEVANYGAVIEGYCYNDTLAESYKTIETLSFENQNIGGIIGYNKSGNVDNVRTMFIVFENGEVGVQDATAYIQGLGNVAGIIGSASTTQLTRAYVENFVEDGAANGNYNIIGKGSANVAGLIASSTSSNVYLSFVQADFDVQGCTFNEFGAGLIYDYVYFIGDVNGVTSAKQTVDGKGYIVINETIKLGFNADGGLIVNNGTQNDYTIEWCVDTQEEDVTKKINKGYPYLRYKLADDIDWTYTLTIRPTDIFVDVDDMYFDADDETEKVTEQGIYIEYKDVVDAERVRATAVVYYNKNDNNTHKLISDDTQKGLIEKTILPSIANGTYVVSILEGGAIATLTDSDSTITFSDTGRVVLKFASAFDRKKTDIVVIFVENPLDDEVFEISTSAGIDKSSDTIYVTRVNTNSIISLGLIGVNGQVFDASKVKYDYQVTSHDTSDKLTISSLTFSASDRHQFEINSKELDKDEPYVDVAVTLNAYLDLSKYNVGYDNTRLLNSARTDEVLLASKSIIIRIYNWATNLTVPSNSNTKAESGVAIPVKATLTTGYKGSGEGSFTKTGETYKYSITGDSNHILKLDSTKPGMEIGEMDIVDYVLTAENSNARNLVNRVIEKEHKKGSADIGIWSLFETPVIIYKSIQTGIEFELTLRIKEEYRDITLEGEEHDKWEFKLEIWANNGKLKTPMQISFVPQQLNNFRLENYSNLVVKTGPNSGEAVAEYVSNQTESSLIIPGTSGLIKVFAEYDYSYFDNITIKSSREVIDGKEYFVRFQQMIYNKEKEVYQSYAGITADGETLSLKRYSYFENGEYTYDGVIFVRTILDDVVGVRKTFTITVNATTYDMDGVSTQISRDKTVITQYRPGVDINVSNVVEEEYGVGENKTTIYLIEKGSDMTTVTARIFGYEYNAQPQKVITDLDGNVLGDSEVSFYQQGPVSNDSTGATIITYKLTAYIDKPFKLLLTITLLDNGNTLTNKSSVLTFYPIDYILDSVRLEGEANGVLNVPVNNSKDLKLQWKTKDGAEISSRNDDINVKVSSLDFLTLFHITQGRYDGLLKDYEGDSFVVGQGDVTKNYFITALRKEETPIPVTFKLYYGYEFTIAVKGGKEVLTGVTLHISATETEICNHFIPYEFMLNLTLQTSEDAPTPVTTVDGLRALGDGEDGILLNDLIIDLNSWSPLTAKISSLDGNGKVISFTGNSFNIEVTQEIDAGLLFTNISEDTILKNVVIDISKLQTNVIYINDDNIEDVSVNFGLLAGVNNGLIYNCEVISLSTAKELELVVGDDYSLTFGGLVGVNNGNITNSRVGTEYFEKITPSGNESVSMIVGCGVISLKTSGIVAGFVGRNASNAIISSSFVANTNIENISSNGDDAYNRTAGFVATNEGTVAYSYAKGIESSIRDSRARATRGQVYASGAGSVAGFVYMNTGKVHDCYSNIVCKSNSAGVAGFVYNTSAQESEVTQCYSASIVESGNTDSALSTELPFVGISIVKNEAQELLSNANMQYCYYLYDGTVEYDTNYTLDENDVEAKPMSLESFAIPERLSGFSFVEGTFGQELNGIWTHSTRMDTNRSTAALVYTSLPELTSANTIARSIRVLVNQKTDEEIATEGYKVTDYGYLKGYGRGTKTNPYIVRDAEEYLKVFMSGEQVNSLKENEFVKVSGGSVEEIEVTKENFVGHVRFIGHVDFAAVADDSSSLNLDTRTTYLLGDRNNQEITSVDGNGMTISNIAISYVDANNVTGSLGLFSEVSYAVIKSIRLEYTQIGSSTATYVGGVAGIANDTYFIDLELNGTQTELFANNVAGGVVGKLVGGHAGIYNVTSNLDVRVGHHDNSESYSSHEPKSDIFKRSYAGGIAGVIDAKKGNIELVKVNVNDSSVRANRAGGIAGYLSENISAERLTYNISTSSQIFGREIAGGLVAENRANIKLSQVNNANDLDQQYEYDKAFGQYIQTEKDDEDKYIADAIDNTNNKYGNMAAVTGEQTVGGFIGVNYGGVIENSLTKANIGHNDEYNWSYGSTKRDTTIGGFIGIAYGGDLSFVYAQNYIDLNYKNENLPNELIYADVVGGLIGEAKYNATPKRIGMYNAVGMNFFDKEQIEKHPSGAKVDYVIGKVSDVEIVKDTANGGIPTINYGVFNPDESEDNHTSGKIVANANVRNANSFNMEDLYSLANTSTQQDIFNSLFASWSSDYWEKIYTRFNPNIKLNGANDYYEIDDAKDIELMNDFPEASFILTKDVTIASTNYVITRPFKGVLTGVKVEDTFGTRYTRFDVALNANTSNDSGDSGAGFFKYTEGAKISNVGFNYTLNGQSPDTVTLHGTDAFHLGGDACYNQVGAVAAVDQASRFENVAVTSISSSSASEQPITTSLNAKVLAMGSIVGNATRSQILGCTSQIDFAINAEAGANIGGLVGTIDGRGEELKGSVVESTGGAEATTPTYQYDGLISSSEYKGSITIKTGDGANIGGVVADADYTRISSTHVDADVCIDSNNTNKIGGIVAILDMCSIEDAIVDLSVIDYISTQTSGSTSSGSSATSTDMTYYVGGIAAEIKNYAIIDAESQNNKGKTIVDSYAKLAFNKFKATNAIIGGIVASQSSSADVILEGVYAETTIEKYKETISSRSVDTDLITDIRLGGIVGQAVNSGTGESSYFTTIKDAMAVLYTDVEYAQTLIGGGLIGYATGSYSIEHATSMGYIFANNCNRKISYYQDKPTLTALGGMVGMVGKLEALEPKEVLVNQSIVNSYTALTLSTATVFTGDKTTTSTTGGEPTTTSHTTYTNGVVGWFGDEITTKSINIDKVVYCSDYTLAIEDGNLINGNKFVKEPVNVSANMLTINNGGVAPVANYLGTGWKYIEDHLPLPETTGVLNALFNTGILVVDGDDTSETIKYEFNDDFDGKPYSPITVGDSTFNDTAKYSDYSNYKYYIVGGDISTVFSDKTLNGVLLGNGVNVASTSSLFKMISEHSAVSNLRFTLANGANKFKNGAVAEKNYGTIFMCSVYYNELNVDQSFGGLADTNAGLISNCFNTGNALYDADNTSVAGLALNNGQTASISDCYFTGSFKYNKSTGGGTSAEDIKDVGSALVKENYGYIANTYSAGQALVVINSCEDEGRYHNVKYDYYANYVDSGKNEEFKALGIEGMETLGTGQQGLQAIVTGSTDSLHFKGWKVYSMHNWDTTNNYYPDKIEAIGTDGKIADGYVDTTYNYGYPVHNFKQYIYDELVKPSYFRPQETGDGTFTQQLESSGYIIVDPMKKSARGQLVADVENEETDPSATPIYAIRGLYDNNSFRINNLGVLSLIDYMSSSAGYYYALEIDISREAEDGEKCGDLLKKWIGVGSSTPFEGIFSSTSTVEKEVKYTTKERIEDTCYLPILNSSLATFETKTDPSTGDEISSAKYASGALLVDGADKYAQGLRGPMFSQVRGNAVIANLNVKNSVLDGEAAVIQNVINSKDAETNSVIKANVTLYNIALWDIHAIGSDVAGFVHTISTINEDNTLVNTLTFRNIYLNNISITGNSLCEVAAGVVFQNGGKIVIEESFAETVIEFKEMAENAQLAGFVYNNTGTIEARTMIKIIPIVNATGNLGSLSGFVHNNSGTIDLSIGGNSTIFFDFTQVTIEGDYPKLSTSEFAGFVNTMAGGIIFGFDIMYDGVDDENSLVCNVFGGVAVEFKGGYIGKVDETSSGSTGSTDDERIYVNVEIPTTLTTNTFGGIVAETLNDESIKTSSREILGVTLKYMGSNKGVVITPKAGNGNAYGLVVGSYDAKTTLDYAIDKAITTGYVLQVTDGQNIGAVIGMASCGQFIFGDIPGSAIVSGAINVGGFIGKYYDSNDESLAGSLVIEGTAWVVEGKDYAQVEVATDVDEDASGIKNVYNFGGLFGYWKSKSNLSCQLKDKNGYLTDTDIINANPVLSFKDVDEVKEGFKFGSSITAKNIGGIVGQLSVSDDKEDPIKNLKNVAQIGPDDHFDNVFGALIGGKKKQNIHGGNNPIYGTGLTYTGQTIKQGTLYTMLQLENVGGLIGLIGINEGGADTGAGAGDVMLENPNIEFGKISGLYSVGGLVGCVNLNSDKSLKIVFGESVVEDPGATPATVDSDEEKSKLNLILGAVDVGGLVGCAGNITIEGNSDFVITDQKLGETTSNSTKIIGVVNVGGLVGKVKAGSLIKISQIELALSNLEIMGNANVGGLIGFAESAEMTDTKISESTIYSTIFDDFYNEGKDVAYYLPTNIGGVAGWVKNGYFKEVTTHTLIASDEIFYIDQEKTQQVTVQMHVNFMPNISGAGSASTKLNKYYAKTTVGGANDIKYNEVEGGIGGFAGRIDAGLVDEEGKQRAIFDDINNYVAGSVYAPFGINVGGVLGFFASDPQIKLPEFLSTGGTSVAGKVFVGGYIGKVTGEFKGGGNSFFEINGFTPIHVQRYFVDDYGEVVYTNNSTSGSYNEKVMAGSCVGGVFGYVTKSIQNLYIANPDNHQEIATGYDSAPIKVYNSDGSGVGSNYVGGLIGRLDGTMENCGIAPAYCDIGVKQEYELNGTKYWQYYANYDVADKNAKASLGVILNPGVYNYGGLVGMVHCTGATVIGTHYYPFTVDTVQTSQFKNENSTIGYHDLKESTGYNVVTAMARYVSNGAIQISMSGLSDLYDGLLSGGGARKDKHDVNPTNGTRGWAKEYTMFRTLERFEKQPNAMEGDYVQSVYCADCIQEVGTTYQQAKVTLGVDASKDIKLQTSKDIAYTVYQPIGQIAKLYCKQGIATQYNLDFKTIYEDEHGKGTFNDSKYKCINYEANSTDHPQSNQIKALNAQFLHVPTITIDTTDGNKDGLIFDRLLTQLDINDPEIAGQKYLDTDGNDSDKTLNQTIFVVNNNMGYIDKGADDDTDNDTLKYDQSKLGATDYFTMGYSIVSTDSWYQKLCGLNSASTSDFTVTKQMFVFDVVFESITMEYRMKMSYAESKEQYCDKVVSASKTTNYSNSGSIFEVTGSKAKPVITFTRENQDEAPGWITALKIVGYVVAGIALVVVAVASYGTAIPAIVGTVAAWVFWGGLALGFVMGLIESLSYEPGITAATIGMTGFVGTAFAIKSAGLSATGIEFTKLSGAEYGALGTVYTRPIDFIGNKVTTASDDVIMSAVNSNIKVEEISDEYMNLLFDTTDKNLCPKYVPVVVGYISCGTGNSVPADFDAKVTLTAAEIASNSAGGSDNVISKIATDVGGGTIEIPKYQTINNEIYMYPTPTSMDKVLITADLPDELTSYPNEVGDYSYVFINSAKIDSFETTPRGFAVNDDLITHIQNTYRVPATITRKLNYVLTDSGLESDYADMILVDNSQISWYGQPTNPLSSLQKGISYNRKIKEKPAGATVYYYDGSYYYYNDSQVADEEVDGEEVVDQTIYYVPKYNMSGGIAYDDFKAVCPDVPNDYYLSHNDSGSIELDMTGYLYIGTVEDSVGIGTRVLFNKALVGYDSDNKEVKINNKDDWDKYKGYKTYPGASQTLEEKYKPKYDPAGKIIIGFEETIKTTFISKDMFDASTVLHYKLIPGQKVNGINLNNYNKLLNQTGSKIPEITYYTRYKHGASLFEFEIEIESKKHSVYSLLKEGALLSESVIFSVSNIGCIDLFDGILY